MIDDDDPNLDGGCSERSDQSSRVVLQRALIIFCCAIGKLVDPQTDE